MIYNFTEFLNEDITSSGNLTQEDVDNISDLMLDFVTRWKLDHRDRYSDSFYEIKRPSKWFIEVELRHDIPRNSLFQSKEEDEIIHKKKKYYATFKSELSNEVDRIRKFGYQATQLYGYESSGLQYYHFQVCK